MRGSETEDLPAPLICAFGGVRVVGPSGDVELGGPKQRAVLALLSLEPNVTVSLDRIVDGLWGDDPPVRPEASVRGYVSNLRKALASAGFDAASVIGFQHGGYVLRVRPEAVDLLLFDRLVDDATRFERLGELESARIVADRAIDLYAGSPLGGLSDHLDVVDVVARYEERRVEAVEVLADVRLALGEHAELPAFLAPEIARAPYRERLRAIHALALYRSGRAVDALRAIDQARRQLADDIGVDPGPELRDLEAAILAHDEANSPGALHRPTRAESVRDRVSDVVVDEPRFGRAAEERNGEEILDRLAVRGGVLVVRGEAGIGKSTLLAGLRAEASRRRLTVGWARCPESAAAAPYHSWRMAVQALLPGSDLVAARREPQQEGAGVRLATHLGELDRLRIRAEPAVVVIDDLQWADDSTLGLLEFLAPELERLRILLAVGVRHSGAGELPSSVRDCLVELGRTSGTVQLTLRGLDAADIEQWIESVTGAAPPTDLAPFVTERTSGNPFYVREVLALLDADGRLDGPFDPTDPTGVPPAVGDVVRRRVSRLPPDTQAVLSVAAVIGRGFDLDVLGVVVELPLGEVAHRLEPGLDDQLVEPDDGAPGRFVFAHALVSATLTDEQNAVRLAGLHARITDAIERLRAADLEPWISELAHHASAGLLAGTAPKALDYSLRAADAADAAQSPTDTALHLRRALAAFDHLPHPPTVARRDLLRRLGIALRDGGDPVARATLVEAARLTIADGDTETAAEILGNLDVESLWPGYDWSLHDPRVVALIESARSQKPLSRRARAQLTMALASELVYVDAAQSTALFDEAHDLSVGLDDAVLSARILLQRFWAMSGPSGLAARASIGDQLVELDDAGALPARLRPLSHLAQVSAALEVCDASKARRSVERARSLAHPVRSPTAWAHLQFAEAGLALLDGDLDRARSFAGTLRPALQRVRRYTADSSPASILAIVETEAGNHDQALAWLDILSGPYTDPINWLRAWVLADAGRTEAARAALAAFDGPLPDDWLQLPLTTAAINAAAAVGDHGFLRRQLPPLEALGDRFAFVGEGGPCLGPTASAVGAAHAALGDRATAIAATRRALDMAERMGAVRWVERARRQLADLSSD